MRVRLFARPADDLKDRADRRGRGAVVWGLIFFAALQAAFYPASYFLPPLADGEYGHKLANLRSQLAAKPKDQPCVVMFGSSLTGWGFNPAAMTGLNPGCPGGPVIHNFGINSAGTIAHLMMLRRVLADGIRPDLVLLETEPQFMLRGKNTVASEHYLQTPRLQVHDLAVIKRYDSKSRELLAEWCGQAWLPWYYHRLNIQMSYLLEWVPYGQRTDVWDVTDRYGWEGALADRSPQRSTPTDLVLGSRWFFGELQKSPNYDPAVRALREMAETCRRRQVPVLFVRMPDNSAFRRPPPAVNERIEGFYEDLRRDTGVGAIDARDWVNDSDFMDGFHLLPEGSVVFSARLGREYLKPILYQRLGAEMDGPSPRLPNAER